MGLKITCDKDESKSHTSQRPSGKKDRVRVYRMTCVRSEFRSSYYSLYANFTGYVSMKSHYLPSCVVRIEMLIGKMGQR